MMRELGFFTGCGGAALVFVPVRAIDFMAEGSAAESVDSPARQKTKTVRKRDFISKAEGWSPIRKARIKIN
jgi:hypothetical protein